MCLPKLGYLPAIHAQVMDSDNTSLENSQALEEVQRKRPGSVVKSTEKPSNPVQFTVQFPRRCPVDRLCANQMRSRVGRIRGVSWRANRQWPDMAGKRVGKKRVSHDNDN